MGHPPFDPPPPPLGDDDSSVESALPPTESQGEPLTPPLTPPTETPTAVGAEQAEPEPRRVERWPGGGRPAGLPPAVVRAVDRVLDALDAAADAVRAAANRVSW